MPALCRDCKTPVHWLKYLDEKGKLAPIEAEKYLKDGVPGNIVVSLEKGLYRIANAAEYEKARLAEKPVLHINHFGRCPNAGKFRKGGKSKTMK